MQAKNCTARANLSDCARASSKKVEDMDPALQMLVDMGYLREAEQETGGRPKAMYIVNPKGKKGN